MGHAHTRTGCLTGVQETPAAMLRLALDPTGAIVPDLKGNLPGRGAWLLASAGPQLSTTDKALIGRLKHAFGVSELVVPDDTGDRIDAQLMERIADYVGLAR